MAVYDVWAEGYNATSNRGRARLMGNQIEADSFREACDFALKDSKFFDKAKLSFWGCRLFETEEEARESFG